MVLREGVIGPVQMPVAGGGVKAGPSKGCVSCPGGGGAVAAGGGSGGGGGTAAEGGAAAEEKKEEKKEEEEEEEDDVSLPPVHILQLKAASSMNIAQLLPHWQCLRISKAS